MTQVALNRTCTRQKRSITGWIRTAISLQRQRNQLARLDSRALEDIGVTRSEAETEARRPVWDAPRFWKR